MKHLFILNPKSGGGVLASECRARVESVMAERGLPYEIYETTGPMDAAEKVRREAIKGEEIRIYACGGDGTLSECAHGAAGYSNAAVTHYPTGTGNDFIKSFDGDTELFRSLDELLDGGVVPLDLIDVNGRRCIDIASVGIDARVGTDVHKYSDLPILGGRMAYNTSLAVNLLKGINRKMTITVEGTRLDGMFALAAVCNGKFYGGGYNPTKNAVPDDGVLDVVVVNKVSVIDLAALLGDYSRGEGEKHPDHVKVYKGRKITIEAPQEFVVNIDGEAMYTDKAVMKLIPHGVNFIMPKSSAFLRVRQNAVI